MKKDTAKNKPAQERDGEQKRERDLNSREVFIDLDDAYGVPFGAPPVRVQECGIQERI